MDYKYWKINGVSLFFDTADLESMERYEKAFDIMTETAKQESSGRSAVEAIRFYCQAHRNLYDFIFGEGTAEKIFADVPLNTDAYDDIFEEFLAFIRNQNAENSRRRSERFDKMKKFKVNQKK